MYTMEPHLTDASIVRTHYVEFTWSETDRIPYKLHLYNKDNSIIRTLSSAPSVFALKRFDCIF